jgi:hypothetical protein
LLIFLQAFAPGLGREEPFGENYAGGGNYSTTTIKVERICGSFIE